MSIISQIIEQQIAQLRYTGLFLALTGNIGEELHRIRRFYAVIKITLMVARTYEQEPTLKGMPVTYNPSSWTSDQLCGYAGCDLEISSDELVASYVESWLTQLRYPNPSHAHFLKCALWYSEKHDQDPSAGLSFLLDLFDHGFFVNWNIFGDVVNSYIRFHALGIDLSFMGQTTIADVALINENLGRITREYEKIDPDAERFEALIAAVGELTMESMQRAREAESLDEWLIRAACVCGPVWWLSLRYYPSKSMGFGLPTRRMLSRIEETGADLHAMVGLRNVQAQFELPPVWGLASYVDIAKGYRERYPDDSWLDRMTEDRLLFPNCVREQIRGVGPDAFTSYTLPWNWCIASEKLAYPLCLAHGRNPSFVRTVDFSPQLIDDSISEMGLPSDREESKVTARRRLLELAEAELIDETRILGMSQVDELRLNELRALYPWHATLCRYDGISRGLRSDFDSALNAFQLCLLIEPDGVEHWLATARLAHLKGCGDDAAAFNEIARLIANIHGKDQ
jgi:hypothetical protein